MNQELPDVQAGFRKGRATRDTIANICCNIKIAREFQTKHLLLIGFSDSSVGKESTCNIGDPG